MKNIVLTTIGLCLASTSFSQVLIDSNFVRKPNNETLYIVENDTLLFNIVNRSLMDGLKGYDKLFRDEWGSMICSLGPHHQDKDYVVNWIIDNNRLYVINAMPYFVTDLTWVRDSMERFCARKFTVKISNKAVGDTIVSSKVMFADWVSGVYYFWSYDKAWNKQLSPARKIVVDKGEVIMIEPIENAVLNSKLRKDSEGRTYSDFPLTEAVRKAEIDRIRKKRAEERDHKK